MHLIPTNYIHHICIISVFILVVLNYCSSLITRISLLFSLPPPCSAEEGIRSCQMLLQDEESPELDVCIEFWDCNKAASTVLKTEIYRGITFCIVLYDTTQRSSFDTLLKVRWSSLLD